MVTERPDDSNYVKEKIIRFDPYRRLQLFIKKSISVDHGSHLDKQINTNKQLLNSVPT